MKSTHPPEKGNQAPGKKVAKGNGAGRPKTNSKWNARHKAKYAAEAKPTSVDALAVTMNMWACYFRTWAIRMDARVAKIEHQVFGENYRPPTPDYEAYDNYDFHDHENDVPGTPTTHLDPPPDEPYIPAPT